MNSRLIVDWWLHLISFLTIYAQTLTIYCCQEDDKFPLSFTLWRAKKVHITLIDQNTTIVLWNAFLFAEHFNIQSRTICIKTIGIYHGSNNCYITLDYFIFRGWDGVWHINQVSNAMTKLFSSFYNSIHLTDSVHEFLVRA